MAILMLPVSSLMRISFRYLILPVLWCFSHFMHILLWAGNGNGCTKCEFQNIYTYRLEMFHDVLFWFAIRCVFDGLVFAFYGLKNKTMKIAFGIYMIGLFNFLGLQVYDVFRCGKDCDPYPDWVDYLKYCPNIAFTCMILFYGIIAMLPFRKSIKRFLAEFWKVIQE